MLCCLPCLQTLISRPCTSLHVMSLLGLSTGSNDSWDETDKAKVDAGIMSQRVLRADI